MKKLIFVTILLIVSVFLSVNAKRRTINFLSKTVAQKPSAIINNHSFDIDVARTTAEKQIGLTKYTNLAQNKGMYFIFEKADYYPFWMKNMKFPIDILFIKQNTIVDIKENASPAALSDPNPTQFTPKDPADAVLEISSGLSKKYNIHIGDQVSVSGL